MTVYAINSTTRGPRCAVIVAYGPTDAMHKATALLARRGDGAVDSLTPIN